MTMTISRPIVYVAAAAVVIVLLVIARTLQRPAHALGMVAAAALIIVAAQPQVGARVVADHGAGVGRERDVVLGEPHPVPEGQARALKVGDPVELAADDLRGVTTQGTVTQVYPAVAGGHRVSADTALAWVQRTLRGYRLPEPTRLADRLASRRDEQR